MKHLTLKRVFSVLLALIMVISLVVPTLGTSAYAANGNYEIQIGETAAMPKAEGNTTWTTSNSSVASVSNDGIVTGVGEGTATITVTIKEEAAPGASYGWFGYWFHWFFSWTKTTQHSYTVTVVKPVQPEEPGTSFELKVGETLALPKTANGAQWSSSDNQIATVSNDGVVTGVKAGTVTITETVKGSASSGSWWGFFWFFPWWNNTTTTTNEYTITVVNADEPEPPEETPVPETPEPTASPEPASEPTVEYNVVFESNGGTPVANDSVLSGKAVKEPEEPEKEGSLFAGWYSNESLESLYDFATPVTQDLTLYAKWEEIPMEENPLDEPTQEVEIYEFTTDTWDIPVGEQASVLFTAEVFSEDILGNDEVCVVDENGMQVGLMHDDGEEGDAEAEDGIFTAQVVLSKDNECCVKYRAECNGQASNWITISFYTAFSDDELDAYDLVMAGLDSVVAPFLNEEGFIDPDNLATVNEKIKEKLEEFASQGKVEEYDVSGNNFAVVVEGGLLFFYSAPIPGTDSTFTVISNQPFKDGYNPTLQVMSDDAADGSARRIALTFDAYQFSSATSGNERNTSADDNYDSDEVSIENLKNLADAQIVTWHGHGGYSKSIGSFMCTGTQATKANLKLYEKDINAKRIIVSANKRLCITGGFIQKYVGNLANHFIYLGTCSSAHDMVDNYDNTFELAQEFVNKGAIVIGNTHTITTSYNTAMEKDVFDYLCEKDSNNNYHTLLEALCYAKVNNGVHDPNLYSGEDDYSRVMIFPRSSSDAINYRLSTSGMLSGNVKNASNNVSVSNALIRVYNSSGNLVTSARSASDGNYNISLMPGSYTISISCGSYKTAKASVVVEAGNVTYLETFLLVKYGLSEGHANGIVSNSISGAGVPEVTINFRKNWNNQTGEIVASVTTSSNGSYDIDIASGSYTMECVKEGYVSCYKNTVILPLDVLTQNVVLSPITSDNTFRIVLTWGENPSDLDSHMVGTLTDENGFHVYYSNKSAYDGDTEVCNLDYDDTTSYGPETVTLTPTTNHAYYYYVYKYAGSGTVGNSGAHINVYRGETLIRSFNVPTNQGDGDYWNVFAIKNGEIIVRNTLTSSADISYAN